MLWEEYRPETMDDFIGHDSLTASILEWIETDTLPHLLFYGKPGTGKTALARLVRKYYLLKERFTLDYDELNGSSERGIDVIRGLADKLSHSWSGKKKIIYIDEAEQLTPDAWKALKKILEKFNKKSIFIFSTNNINKIPEAIVSRCYAYEFLPHDDENVRKIIDRVAKDKNVTVSPEIEKVFIEKSEGDLRKLIGTYMKMLVSNPNLRPEDIEGDNRDKMIERLRGLIKKTGVPSESMKRIVDAMKTLRKKFSVHEVIRLVTTAAENPDVALLSGYVSSWIAMSVPEDIALLSFAAGVVKHV